MLDRGDGGRTFVCLCTANPRASCEYLCPLQYSNDFVLAQSVCVSALGCTQPLMHELCIYTYSPLPARIHPRTFMWRP